MAATRYKPRLYRGLSVQGAEVEVNLDREDVPGLRGGSMYAKVWVDGAGRTVVR